MARKKEKNKPPVKDIDYIALVDEMSEAAFSLCVSYLYPLYNYRVIRQEDIRRIDLKENLLRLNSRIPGDLKKNGELNYYLFEMKLYMARILVCKEGSRAEKYKKRVEEAIEMALGECGSFKDVEDAFFGFIILLHMIGDKLDGKAKYTIDKPADSVEIKDADILRKLYDSKECTPDGLDGKTGFIDKKLSLTIDRINARQYFYINSIILLSRSLQKFGIFETED